MRSILVQSLFFAIFTSVKEKLKTALQAIEYQAHRNIHPNSGTGGDDKRQPLWRREHNQLVEMDEKMRVI
jgi:hypothetical protein